MEETHFRSQPDDPEGGIKLTSVARSPGKISEATKAYMDIEQWEDRMVKLVTEYDQGLIAKMNVAVLFSVPLTSRKHPLDACALNWDSTPESKAREMLVKHKSSI
jgi:hypothetical protein